MKRIFIAGASLLFATIMYAQNVGIGTPTPGARLQINHRSNTTAGLQLLDSTALRSGTIRFSTINNPVGMTMRGAYESSFNKGHYLDIISDSTFIATFRGDGNVGIGTFSPTAKLDVNGAMKIQGTNSLEFGAGVTKEINAGKIGYQTFTPGALDIIGAGTTVATRKVNFFAEGGTTFNGQVKITGGAPAAGKVLTSDATGLASWQSSSLQTYYPSVTICCQSWMTKNLDVDTYRNGDAIPQVTDPTTWAALTTGAWCYNNNSPANDAIYGKLYNWYAVNDPRGLAPEGWHIPTDFEWTTLENCLGGASIVGGAMKEIGTTHWTTPNLGATNISGWTGLPGGYRNPTNGTFISVGNYGYWWSSTEFNTSFAWLRYLFFNNGTLSRDGSPMQGGFSVRCIRD
jgi:uncharacterized protein (TIGR02145 family)